MAPLRHNLIRVLFVMLTLSVFAGELIADALYEDIESAVTQSSNDAPIEKGSCPTDGSCPDCCAVHNGAAIGSNWTSRLKLVSPMLTSFATSNEHAPSGDPVAIEYPPRLA